MENQNRILVVDDEPDIRQLLKISLSNLGYALREAATGMEAVELLQQEQCDLIIMDIMMPDMDGLSACQAIRRFSTAPVLFLTARTQTQDKASAYQCGGDDFLGKPFLQSELQMKVESLLRRYCVYKGKNEDYRGASLYLDMERRCAVKNGAPVELTSREFEILRFFFQHRGEAVEVKALYEGAWGESYMPRSNNTVMVHIVNLRKKLEDDPAEPKLIRTIWGKGYEFG